MKILTTFLLASLASTSLVMAAEGDSLPSLDEGASVGLSRTASIPADFERADFLGTIAQGDAEVLEALNAAFSSLSIEDFDTIREELAALDVGGDRETAFARIKFLSELNREENAAATTALAAVASETAEQAISDAAPEESSDAAAAGTVVTEFTAQAPTATEDSLPTPTVEAPATAAVIAPGAQEEVAQESIEAEPASEETGVQEDAASAPQGELPPEVPALSLDNIAEENQEASAASGDDAYGADYDEDAEGDEEAEAATPEGTLSEEALRAIESALAEQQEASVND